MGTALTGITPVAVLWDQHLVHKASSLPTSLLALRLFQPDSSQRGPGGGSNALAMADISALQLPPEPSLGSRLSWLFCPA